MGYRFKKYIHPEGTLNVTANGDYEVSEKETVNVNIESGSGEDMLQARVDAVGCKYLFTKYTGYNVDYISGLDTSKVTDMSYMFDGCSNLTTIPLLNTENVTDMSYMFQYCSKLTAIPQLDTSKVTSMQAMFMQCSKLTTIHQLDTSNVTNMGYIFYGCSNLTSVPQLDTNKVTNMTYMFSACKSLTTIPQLDTSNVTNMSYMFSGSSALTTVPQLDTSKVTNMSGMFNGCNALETIDITYYKINSGYVSSFAYNCTALKALIIREFGAYYVLEKNSLQNSGIANGTGYIYVPRNMVDTLKSATNWSTYADQIRALEDYTIDGTTTGALDETKI